MKKIFIGFIILQLLLFGSSFPWTGGLIKIGKRVFSLSSKSMVRSIDDILEEAILKGRINNIEKYRLHTLYTKLPKGERLLDRCLKTKSCNPFEAVKIAKKSDLHRDVLIRNPSLTLAQVNQRVGQVNEYVMNKYFLSTGWRKLEGEVGRSGLDGLFVKKKKGKIVDVLIVESKYNKSQLGTTNFGRQMSKEWIVKKINNLIKKFQNTEEYKQIKRHIAFNNYRALFWKMKQENGKIKIYVDKIKNRGSDILKEKLKGGEKIKISYTDNQEIDINNPKNDYHKKIVNWYEEALNKVSK